MRTSRWPSSQRPAALIRLVPPASAAPLGLRSLLLGVETPLVRRARTLGGPPLPRRWSGRRAEQLGHPLAGRPAVGELRAVLGGRDRDHTVGEPAPEPR